MKNNTIPNVAIEILVNGKPIKQHLHNQKWYAEGREGSEYSIKVTNNKSARILVAGAIDGLNFLNGKVGDSDYGYVLHANSSFEVKGYRIDDKTVAAFKFGRKENSYAVEKQMGHNTGIIAIKSFDEKIDEPVYPIMDWGNDEYIKPSKPWPRQPATPWEPYRPWWNDVYCGSPPPSPSASDYLLLRSSCSSRGLSSNVETASMENSCKQNESDVFSLGTEWGQTRDSVVTSTSFEKGSEIGGVEIFYMTKESLIKIGVPLKNEIEVNYPTGFPKDAFCAKPKNWKG